MAGETRTVSPAIVFERERMKASTAAPVATQTPGPHGPAHRAHQPRPRRWRLSWASVIAAVLGVTGMLVFMYPSTAGWWSSYNQTKVIVANNAVVRENLTPGNAEKLAQAHKYNELLSAGASSRDFLTCGGNRDSLGHLRTPRPSDSQNVRRPWRVGNR